MRHVLLVLSLAAATSIIAVELAACSSSSSGPAGASSDAAIARMSCGATIDCQVAGLDAATCVYKAAPNSCASVGQCQEIVAPASASQCAPSITVCPCSGGTQTVPSCMQGWSTVAVLSIGPCPADAGGS